jgi:hypothetical protein
VRGVTRTWLPSLRLLELAQFLAEKLYSHQHCNNGGTDHGGSTNLLAGEAEVIMGNVCQRARGGDRRGRSHHKNQNSPTDVSIPRIMRPRLARSSLIDGHASGVLSKFPGLRFNARMPELTRRWPSGERLETSNESQRI